MAEVGEFYEDDEPIEKVMAIISQPPDVITLGPVEDDIVLHLAELTDDARARLQRRANREGRPVADVVTAIVARHA